MKKARCFGCTKKAVDDVFCDTFHTGQGITVNGKHEVGHAPISSTVKFSTSEKDDVTLRLSSKCPENGSEVVLEAKSKELTSPTLFMNDLPLYKGTHGSVEFSSTEQSVKLGNVWKDLSTVMKLTTKKDKDTTVLTSLLYACGPMLLGLKTTAHLQPHTLEATEVGVSYRPPCPWSDMTLQCVLQHEQNLLTKDVMENLGLNLGFTCTPKALKQFSLAVRSKAPKINVVPNVIEGAMKYTFSKEVTTKAVVKFEKSKTRGGLTGILRPIHGVKIVTGLSADLDKNILKTIRDKKMEVGFSVTLE
eukprot:TRINITY_DN1182_c0_g1_i1.p1 TRINITY_DN1182_c0_g1~~TRINITY_DN1182_c0_g1_i1.p1  ORF type:complete len:349 (+),score=92.59 TRINITY_DN1182_c0_g1_i1:138-1049(+)